MLFLSFALIFLNVALSVYFELRRKKFPYALSATNFCIFIAVISNIFVSWGWKWGMGAFLWAFVINFTLHRLVRHFHFMEIRRIGEEIRANENLDIDQIVKEAMQKFHDGSSVPQQETNRSAE